MGKLRSAVCFLVALVVPAVAFGVTQPVCKCGPVTPESYKWNFSKEAAGLLNQIHNEAYHAKSFAGTLEAFNREPGLIGWQAEASKLTQEKHAVNLMDQHLCRLRLIARVLPPDQRAEVRAITPAVLEATDTTQAAIVFLNHHEDELFVPRYTHYANDLYSETNRVESATSSHAQYLAMNETGPSNTAAGS